jgi:fucose permease
MSFALRGDAAGAWQSEFGLSNEQLGWVNGTAFWGFTLAMIFGGPLCDTLGLKRIVWLAFFGHVLGIIVTITAGGFWTLFGGTLIFGIANGLVEAGCNPLITALYPKDKTTKLNHFHVWFPGGIVIGGLLAYFLGSQMGFGWRVQFGLLLVPTALYGLRFLGQAFPKTERVEHGVSTKAMFMACLNPLFIFMVICMLMTAATELGPGQWIPKILTEAGVSGILVLVWITGLMALGRQFAGVFVHRINAPGMLFGSAVLSALGLYLMSQSSGGMLFVAATVFAFGVCFFWPTMLGFVAEQFPKTGALGLAIMGGAGMLSVSIVLPIMGRIYDRGIEQQTAAAGPGADPSAIEAAAGLATLGQVAVLPVILAVVFGVITFVFRSKGGYRPKAMTA